MVKRLAVMFAVVIGMTALIPVTAVARDGSNCDYASDQDVTTGGDPAAVYADTSGGNGGITADSDVAIGACVNTDTGAFQGGSVEVGAGDDGNLTEGYAVVDGDDNNTDPSGQSDGYAGVSTFENGTVDDCDAPADNDGTATDEGGSGTNSGGCLSLRPGGSGSPAVVSVPVVPVVCGNQTGNQFEESTRDGCTIR